MSLLVPMQHVEGGANPPGPPATLAAPETPRKLGRLAARAALALDTREIEFCVQFAECGNARVAYENSHVTQGMTHAAIRKAAQRCSGKPSVQRFLHELMGEAARDATVEVAELLADDLAIVRAARMHGHELSQHVIEACRYCHGREHKYHWVDLDEYLRALMAAEDDNEARRERKLATRALPTDEGGYGFMRSAEAHINCPKCEGRGVPARYFADTERLAGPVLRLVRGVKQGTNGQLELLTYDADKAKERLYKAAGAFGDDAASVARGAAMGAAAGAAAAHELAKRIDSMNEDEARKSYLTLV